MPNSSHEPETSLAPRLAAPQHRPRPLPLFLSLLREETAADPERARRALEGLRRYQQAPRSPPSPPMPAVAERQGAVVRDYGAGDPDAPVVLFVPSLINPPGILDLDADRSLLRWIAGEGFRPLLLDWGWPGPERGAMSVADHVETILVPLLRGLERPVQLVGYCLGGTMAMAAAGRTPVLSIATLAAPWRFSAYPPDASKQLSGLWAASREITERIGLLPMEVLQSAFWRLDSSRTIAKFESFAALGETEAQRFVRLEDWANDGPPLAAAAARELFEDFFADDCPGTGRWMVGDAPVDPRRIGVPILEIVSRTDRIVPAASAADAGERLELDLGHVGMMIGSQARQRLWIPLREWLCRHRSTC